MPRCRIGLFVTIALGLLVAPRAADAQPVGKVVRDWISGPWVPRRQAP